MKFYIKVVTFHKLPKMCPVNLCNIRLISQGFHTITGEFCESYYNIIMGHPYYRYLYNNITVQPSLTLSFLISTELQQNGPPVYIPQNCKYKP